MMAKASTGTDRMVRETRYFMNFIAGFFCCADNEGAIIRDLSPMVFTVLLSNYISVASLCNNKIKKYSHQPGDERKRGADPGRGVKSAFGLGFHLGNDF